MFDDLGKLSAALFAPQPTAGGGGANAWAMDPMLHMGLSLLSAGQPSTNLSRDNSWGGAMLQGLNSAQQMQSAQMMNDLRRQSIVDKQTEKQNLQSYQQAIAAGEDPMTAARMYFPESVMKAEIQALTDPNVQLARDLKLLQKEQVEKAIESDNFTMAENKQAVGRVSRQLDTALSAIEYLESVPGAETIFLNPDVAAAARKGDANLFTKEVTGFIANNLTGVPQAELDKVLSAAELVHKSIKNIAGSQQRAVAGQKMAAEGLGGGGAGLSTVKQVLGEEKKGVSGLINSMGWTDLVADPNKPKNYPFSTPKVDAVSPLRAKKGNKQKVAMPPQGAVPVLAEPPDQAALEMMHKQGITHVQIGTQIFPIVAD